jgi:hypothetical protein
MAEYDEDGVINERPQLPAMAESRPQNLIFASQDCGEVFGALCEMQGEMGAPRRTKNAKVKGKTRSGAEYSYEYSYAPLDEIIATIKAPMKGAGLAYRQFLAQRGGQHVMRTIIAHRSGQWMGTDYPIFWDESRGMQGFASGVTYARRYGLMLALGIAAEDDDDANVADGNVAQVQDRRKPAPEARTEPEAVRRPPVAQEMPLPPPASPRAPRDDIDRNRLWEDYKTFQGAVEHATSKGEIETLFNSHDWEAIAGALEKIGEGKRVAVTAKLGQQVIDRLHMSEVSHA